MNEQRIYAGSTYGGTECMQRADGRFINDTGKKVLTATRQLLDSIRNPRPFL